jgi:hypothetical protein
LFGWIDPSIQQRLYIYLIREEGEEKTVEISDSIESDSPQLLLDFQSNVFIDG